MTYNILIVDDDIHFSKVLGKALALEKHHIFQASGISGCISILKKENIDVILLDQNLPDGHGVEVIPKIKKLYPLVQTIVLTGDPNIKTCVTAIKNGAADYILKNGDIDQILCSIKQQTYEFNDSRISDCVRNRIVDTPPGFGNIIGTSTIILDTIELAKKVADTDASVLLLGETGTGKELFARAIHQNSSRKNAPFVAINCSAFSKNLLESELFGYIGGAFTGAQKDKKGLLEEADSGTLFLDEIGEIDADLQAKLLRVLETGEFIKVGDYKVTLANVRLISATNKDLVFEISRKKFREDLFYRLNIFSIRLPALRERKEDILLLTEYFVKLFSKKMGKNITGITKGFEKILVKYSWKGNVRELKNIVERSVILAEGSILSEDLMPFEMLTFHYQEKDDHSPYDLGVLERAHIQKVLVSAKWNKSEAAKLLNISLSTLYRKIEDYTLSKQQHN
jgi:two-component system NtrC family response regulator